MCGIAGLVSYEQSIEECCERVQLMTKAQQHRGPDGSGVEAIQNQKPAVVFGHRRLAIIDLSSAGYQPMLDQVTGNWLAFNGEIYNYQSLRHELIHKGAIFHSHTDSEVILKSYAMWGDSFIQRLEGMFAFAIWDRWQRRLLLARDPLGIKPLYYHFTPQNMVFASEVRALLSAKLVERRLSLPDLYGYLSYGSVQEPGTLIQGIHSLPPGHILTWQDRKLNKQRFWQLPAHMNGQYPAEDLDRQLKDLLTNAVTSQLVADVPLGAFLSGGIDSTSIVALMRQQTNQVKTFSIVFNESAYDERRYAQLAAKQIGTDHTELLVDSQTVLRNLPSALAAFDQPSMDGLNTYFVSKVTREAGITVALSGVGGDELFAGYSGYHKPLLLERWGNALAVFPAFARRTGSYILRLLPERELIRRGVDLLLTNDHPYFLARRVFSSQQIASLLYPEVHYESAGWYLRMKGLEGETAVYDPINRASALELQTYMLSTLLRDTDQMSMSHALEVRVPLLDQQLVQYLLSIAGQFKLVNKEPKPLLTRPLKNMLPIECIYRPKQGFTFPFAYWLRQHLQDEIKEMLLSPDPISQQLFNIPTFNNLWQGFKIGQISWSRIWSLFVLNHWLAAHAISL